MSTIIRSILLMVLVGMSAIASAQVETTQFAPPPIGYGPQAPPPGLFPGPGLPPQGPFQPPVPFQPQDPIPQAPFPPPPPPPGFGGFERPHALRDYAWLYNEVPRPREIKVHDIVTIIVKEQAETTVDSRFNRNRTATLKAELKEFLRLDNDGNLTSAALNAPSIDANLTGRLQSQGSIVEREGMIYRIAATVVDVLPNGNIVLEARKSIRTNRDVSEYSLTGTIRSVDILRDNSALSENIANLQIQKTQRGKVYDSTRVPWGTRLYDWLFPF